MKLRPKFCKNCRFLVLVTAFDPRKKDQNPPDYPLCMLKTHEHISFDSLSCVAGIRIDNV